MTRRDPTASRSHETTQFEEITSAEARPTNMPDLSSPPTPSTLKRLNRKSQAAGPKKIRWVKGALIGTGSFGSVYLGLNAKTGELMAVKQVILPSATGEDGTGSVVSANSASESPQQAKLRHRKQTMVDALQREISLLRELEHPNIVRYLGSECNDTFFNIFLEYVPGGSLSTLIQNYGTFEEVLIRTFVKQILSGLVYLHEKNIVHRDIKGANILVDNKSVVKIVDFGISKKMAEPDAKANRGSVISLVAPGVVQRDNRQSKLQGSVFWMAPEVVKSYHYSKKADIWSLGCLIVEMITGKNPWAPMDQMQAMYKIGMGLGHPPYDESGVSPELKGFLERCFTGQYKERAAGSELVKHPFLDGIVSSDSMTSLKSMS